MARSTLPFSQPAAGLQARGIEAVFASEGEKARKEADQAAIVFGHGGGQIVIGDFARDTAAKREGMHVTADEGFKALAVSELQIEHAAVRIDQREGIELALVAGVVQRAEVPPIDFETLAGAWLHAHEGATRIGVAGEPCAVVAQDGVAAAIAERP